MYLFTSPLSSPFSCFVFREMRAPAAAPRRFCCVPPTALEAKLAAAPLLQRRQRQRAATASAKASAAAPIVDDTVDRGRNRPVRFVLVRHGQSTWTAEGRIQGSSDISVLTEKGKRQAREAAELVRKKGGFSIGIRRNTRLAIVFPRSLI